jgi:hypothetical protein
MCFKNEGRKKPIDGSEHESKRKMPKRKTKMKMGVTDSEVCHTKGRTWEETEEELWEDTDREMARQMP